LYFVRGFLAEKLACFSAVIARHSRSKNGVASLAYARAIQ
jgi:hypothetical protein